MSPSIGPIPSAMTFPRRLQPLFHRPSLSPILHARFPRPTPSPFTTSALRPAARKPKSKAPVLEKPDAFRPPSHGARLPRRRPDATRYGPSLTEAEAQTQKTKQYPRMMPPEGSFLHWFLSDRSIHVWISMVRIQLSILTLAR
ncbi:hypothetical protein P152DRAFT_453939 [Eremomyces bilateralis CBS 781.70]|uniref:Uncharacterized protein n=1 Tax=Eremomyces bilateralis CBS 781.70 TaxID=1392243 RepID=A0A6G1GH09_9PEZI|nr:uncharacterized protein P152DRAFT_453939 [Eremomyces bilateralis CBS 781.70]KAF1817358.1 hypothetical protein P152DRAFT_453939 [Eremomyces bilateralis CBS 781.70]